MEYLVIELDKLNEIGNTPMKVIYANDIKEASKNYRHITPDADSSKLLVVPKKDVVISAYGVKPRVVMD